MKKLFLVALAGMMMFAFTQCGGAFSSAKSAINDAISGIEKAEKCEDLQAVDEAFEKEMAELEEKYEDYEPTEEESKEIADLTTKMMEAYSKKMAELCK